MSVEQEPSIVAPPDFPRGTLDVSVSQMLSSLDINPPGFERAAVNKILGTLPELPTTTLERYGKVLQESESVNDTLTGEDVVVRTLRYIAIDPFTFDTEKGLWSVGITQKLSGEVPRRVQPRGVLYVASASGQTVAEFMNNSEYVEGYSEGRYDHDFALSPKATQAYVNVLTEFQNRCGSVRRENPWEIKRALGHLPSQDSPYDFNYGRWIFDRPPL